MRIETLQKKETKEVEILDFEKTETPTELVVKERETKDFMGRILPSFYASFEGCKVKDGNLLKSVNGDGNTIDEAIQNYCKEISNQTLIFHAYTNNREEVLTPKLIHTKLLNK